MWTRDHTHDYWHFCFTLSGREELANASFSYFLHLFMEHYRREANDLLRETSLGEQCVNYIEENYMCPIMVEDIARHIQRSPNYTSALFRKVIGVPLTEYLNRIRIKHACCQLSYSEASIEAVAKQCGFKSVRYFSRVFVSIMNTTPNRFRTSHRVEDMYFIGTREQYSADYDSPSFTYIPSAQKRIDWKTPLDYYDQLAKE